jgi:hypothetical protein
MFPIQAERPSGTREMIDATISRVRMRDLARPGRYRPD